MTKKSTTAKRDRPLTAPSTANTPSTSPALKSARVESAPAMATPGTATAADQPMAAVLQRIQRELEGLKEENVHIKARMEQVEEHNRQLTEQNRQLADQLTATTKVAVENEDEAERLRVRLNSNRICLKGVQPDTSKEAIKAQLTDATEGLPLHSVIDVYQSGPCQVVILDTMESALKVLKAQGRLYKTTQWRADRSLTKKQRAARAAQSPEFLRLREAGAYPRFHGTNLMVRMTTGVKPATQWDPSLKLPPRPAAAGAANPQHPGQQQPQQRQGPTHSYAAAARGASPPAASGPRASSSDRGQSRA